MSADESKLREIDNFVAMLTTKQIDSLYNIITNEHTFPRKTKRETVRIELSTLIDD